MLMLRRLLLALVACGSSGLTVDDQAQTVVQGATGSCTRYYSEKGHVGCATMQQGGEDAELFGITTAAHLAAFVAPGAAASGKRALVMDLPLLDKTAMTALLATKRVAGILLLQPTPAPAAWSPGGHANGFNPKGFDFLDQKFDFPISLVDAAQTASLLRYAQGNRDAAASPTLLPVYKAKLDFFMGAAAVNAKVCLQWRTLTGAFNPRCVPIGGASVWSVLTPSGANPPFPAQVVMATAQMDARSPFYGLAPGADTAASGAVALLAAAHALSKVPLTASMYGIAFALFQGESWNNMGSATFVDDILHFNCTVPAKDRNNNTLCLKPAMGSLAFQKLNASLQSVTAVDQVGKKGAQLYLHAAQQSTLMDPAIKNVKKSTKFGTKADAPAGTASAFKRMTGVKRFVLGGYDTAFPPYFSGHLDKVATVDAATITVAATALAQTLWKQAQGDGDGPEADAKLVAEMFTCVTQNWACDLWKTHAVKLNAAINRESAPSTYPMPPSPTINGEDRTPAATSLDLYTSTIWGQPAGVRSRLGSRLPFIVQTNLDKRCSARATEAKCTEGGTNGCSWNNDECVKTGGNGILNFLKSNSTWDKDQDAVLVWPNRYELSAFAFLANASNATLGLAQHGAYYHTALSRAVVLPQYATPGSSQADNQYNVSDDATPTTKALLFAEPYWVPVSATVYTDAGDAVAYGALAAGLVVAAVGAVCAKQTREFMTKQKLL